MTIGVMLLAFGGADAPEAIEPFMSNLMGGRKPPPELVAKIKERYALIGGKSPLPEITRRQAQALEQLLNDSAAAVGEVGGAGFKVVVGMRYWHPFIAEALHELTQAGIKKVVAVSLAPFYSQVSTGTYEAELKRAAAQADAGAEGARAEGAGTEVIFAGGWDDRPKFISAVAAKVKAALRSFSAPQQQNVPVIFSAHSLPVSHIEAGDPYARQFEATVAAVVRELGLTKWYLAYQSKGGGQGEWLGPMVEEIMDKLAAAGDKEVLVVPVGFVSDHIETLYDIDIAQKRYAEDKGLNFSRTESLNTSPEFIATLAEVVLNALKQ